MKLAKVLMPLLIIIGFSATSSAQTVDTSQETRFERDLNTRDDQPVRQFVESKENIDVKRKASNLEISGDVRFEWRTINEKGGAFFTSSYSDDFPYTYYGDGTYEGDGTYDGDDYSLSDIHENFRHLRGGSHVDARGLPISHNDFDVEFNLKFKYTFQDAWAAAHLQFDNPAGTKPRDCTGVFPLFNKEGSEVEEELDRDGRKGLRGSGDGSFINLKRAYMGYNIWADGKQRLDIEVGRRKLDDVFDSEIQFTSRFDGILLKYASAINDFADWYIDFGAFVIDERVNHFGFVGEIGYLNIFDTGLDLRYNFIDWVKKGRNRCFEHDPIGTRFVNSEITVTYTIKPTIFDKETPIEFYGGFLINTAAPRSRFTFGKRKNLGWYAGIYVNKVLKKGDWALDLEYVVVQAQAVPDNDVGSIGRGNILDENLFDSIFLSEVSLDNLLESQFSSIDDARFRPRRGNTNFVGYRFEFFYAITDNLTIDIVGELSNEEDRRIGGPHYYSDFEIEAIYAF